MIEFDCQSCGNHFRVQVDLAGRHGWCKVCQSFIVIPTLDPDGHPKVLTPHERELRMEHLLREAGVRQERNTLKLALLAEKQKEVQGRLSEKQGEPDELVENARLVQAERALERLSSELSRTAQELGKVRSDNEYLSRELAVAPANPPGGLSLQSEAERPEAQLQQFLSVLSEKDQALGAAQAGAQQARDDAERLRSELRLRQEALESAQGRALELERDAARVEGLERERLFLIEQLETSQSQLTALREEMMRVALDSEHAASRAAQAALELDRLRTEAEDAHRKADRLEVTVRTLEAQLRESEAHLARLHTEKEALYARAESADRLEREVSTAQTRLQEMEATVLRMTPDLTAASQALGAYEARMEQSARDLERLKAELTAERASVVQKESARRDAALSGDAVPAPSRIVELERAGDAQEDDGDFDDESALIPEIIDDDSDSDQSEMVDVLLRFLEPEDR